MATRALSTAFWRDPRVRALPPRERTILLGLLLGPDRTVLPGLVAVDAAALGSSMGPGLPATEIEAGLAELEQRGLVRVDAAAPLVWVPDGPAWDMPPGGKTIPAWVRLFAELPPSRLVPQALDGLVEHVRGQIGADVLAILKNGAESEKARQSALLDRVSIPYSSFVPRARAAPAPAPAPSPAPDHVELTDPWGLTPPGSPELEAPSPPEPSPAKAGLGQQAREVFEHWQTVLGHPRAKLDAKRRSRIQARLREGFSVAELKLAIDGVRLSAWHMGDNPDGRTYDGIETILREAAQVEKFRDLAERARRKRPTPTPLPRKAPEQEGAEAAVPCPPELRARIAGALHVIPGGRDGS